MSDTIVAVSVVVRRPTVADADDLARINIASWRDAYTGLIPQPRIDEMSLPTYRQLWIDRLSADTPDIGFFAAVVNGTLTGYATCGPYRKHQDAEPEDNSGFGELYALYSDPRLHKRGAGTAAHDAALAWLANAGYREAVLWVLTANERARLWYAARHWEADGTSSNVTAHGEALPHIRLRHSLS